MNKVNVALDFPTGPDEVLPLSDDPRESIIFIVQRVTFMVLVFVVLNFMKIQS